MDADVVRDHARALADALVAGDIGRATTDFSTIVNLRERSAKFKGDDLGIVIVKGQHRIDLVWDGNTRLRLQCSDCRPEDIFKQERSWKDVEISLER